MFVKCVRELLRGRLQKGKSMATREEVYDAEIFPLMGKVLELCQEHKIPMIASFVLEPGRPGLACTSVLTDDSWIETPQLKRAANEILRGTEAV